MSFRISSSSCYFAISCCTSLRPLGGAVKLRPISLPTPMTRSCFPACCLGWKSSCALWLTLSISGPWVAQFCPASSLRLACCETNLRFCFSIPTQIPHRNAHMAPHAAQTNDYSARSLIILSPVSNTQITISSSGFKPFLLEPPRCPNKL